MCLCALKDLKDNHMKRNFNRQRTLGQHRQEHVRKEGRAINLFNSQLYQELSNLTIGKKTTFQHQRFELPSTLQSSLVKMPLVEPFETSEDRGAAQQRPTRLQCPPCQAARHRL